LKIFRGNPSALLGEASRGETILITRHGELVQDLFGGGEGSSGKADSMNVFRAWKYLGDVRQELRSPPAAPLCRVN
jgi:antitoxin (DNA-binding transcriptional repressor) of toxin-antitoxin stability system